MPYKKKNTIAFSLVELSIVLVILGLLVGGVLSGQSLIHAAELRAVTTEYTSIVSATHQFRDKYFALPGDFNQATRFWQKQNMDVSYAATCTNSTGAPTNATFATGACDGNGDGRIVYNTAVAGAYEGAQFWQHLRMAGLIQKNRKPGSLIDERGVNFGGADSDKESRIANAYWSVSSYPQDGDGLEDDALVGSSSAQILSLGSSWAGFQPSTSVIFSTEDAWNLDKKMDDGNAAAGKIRAFYTNSAYPRCHQTTSYSATDYDLSSKGIACALMVINPF